MHLDLNKWREIEAETQPKSEHHRDDVEMRWTHYNTNFN